MLRLGILGSTNGTVMRPIIDAIENKILSASIEIVISNRAHAMILTHAKAAGIPTGCVDNDDPAFEEKLSHYLVTHRVDVVILIGFMRILSREFITPWAGKMINIHPSLLPLFANKRDEAVHQAVLNSGLNETGCTVHYVTEKVDAGPILIQKKCRIDNGDTVILLKKRVQQLEAEALIEAINLLCSLAIYSD